MLKVKIYNQTGVEAGDLELSENVFGVKPKESVVHQVYVAQMANAREPWAHTKNKGEVRGGGKKPWRQKGTGRARHGSIRSPLWKGGGVTFGPLKTRNYKQKINKKMNQLAVKMCLSDKVVGNQLVVLDDIKLDGKTKSLANLRRVLPGSGRTTLWLMSEKDEQLAKAARNLVRVDLKVAKDVSVIDLLHHQYIVITKKGVEILEKRFS
ncbi:MAG: 50S ribosomal protein L4 [Candidatus Magasanikbacteria bacterium]|nr:50S ribosomal protein L4 [Candidatus Magasanikbacteria bacterium]